jgi:elongation factor Ts
MTTVAISAADVNNLRQKTGAGMMDCKKALIEANGDMEAAIDILRKKGQKIAANRQDREAKEGYVFGKVTDDLKNLKLGNITVAQSLLDQMGKIGEKIDVVDYQNIAGEKVVVYNHPGNKLTAMIAFSAPVSDESGKDVAMQIAAMAPVAIDRDDVDAQMLERELEIARDQARQEGKPENMIEKIATGKLNKFYNEYTLLNQVFIKDDKKTIRQYLEGIDKNIKVNAFRRLKLG